MTFRITQIVFTADGRRIERSRDVADGDLRVGRFADNDIQLADLAVEPHHLRIISDGKRLKINALAESGFTLDGEALQTTTIEPARGGELRLGGASITISRADDGVTLLTVQAQQGDTKAADPLEDRRRFSLASVLKGRRLVAWLAVAAILIGLLIVPIVSHMMRQGPVIGDKHWNPGALSLAHQNLTNRCESCHVDGFKAVNDTTCKSCHATVHDHAAPTRTALARGTPSLGGRMLDGVAHMFGRPGAGSCIDCHTEHNGAAKMAPPQQQFCADCHIGLKDRLPDTKLGDAGDFATLHPQLTANIISNADTKARLRVSLDGHPHEDSGLSFSHQVHLGALGGVAKMAMSLPGYGKALTCQNCHHTTDDGVRFKTVNMERDCQACHSLVYDRVGGTFRTLQHGKVDQMVADLSRASAPAPVAPARARPGAYAAGQIYGAHFTPPSGGGILGRAMAKDGICGECHTQGSGGGLSVRPVTLVSRYMEHGWFDHRKHVQTQCTTCHNAKSSQSSSDILLPKLAECRTCHGGEATHKPLVPSTCAMCHAYHISPLAPPRGHPLK